MAQIVNEYAEALFALASESKKEKEFLESLTFMCDILEENPQYVDFLESVSIPKAERTANLDEIFLGKTEEYVLSLADILCEKGRIRSIFSIRDEYEKMYFAFSGTCVAIITSAVELDAAQKAKIERKIEVMCSHQIKPVYRTDKSLMGGITVEVDGKVIDYSVAHRLDELKEVIRR